jgi:protein-export membrane protein SecD
MKEHNAIIESLRRVFKALVSLIAPLTPRGKIRRSIFVVVILLFLTGLLSYPNWWNKTADKINSWSNETLGFNLRIPAFWEVPFQLGLDLQGGTHLVYIADMSSIPAEEQDDSIAGVRDVIEHRVNAFGISEPLVQTNKSGDAWRLIVDLAGVSDISEAIRQIGETPILEFKEENLEPPRALTKEEQLDMNKKNAEAKSLAQLTWQEVQNSNANFGSLAAERSTDMKTKGTGGDLGFQTKTGEYFELVQAAIDSGVTAGHLLPKVIETSRGYHVVRFEETREGAKEVKASHILLCWKGALRCEAERSKEEALALAQELRGQATTENFAALATENSNDISNAQQGGDLGWFAAGAMVQSFNDAAMNLEVEQISEPVETDFGYHLIYKTDERSTLEYRLAHIQFTKKVATDYVPPADEWKNTQLSGKHLKRSIVEFHQQTNEPQVGLEFNDEGKDLFADITQRNVGKPVAIFLDGQPISVPTVNEAITGGKAVITGNFTILEAKLLVRRLNAGALPVPINLETQQSVGATLGNNSLLASLRAGLIGFLVVALFMLLYYRLPGIVAIAALLIYTSINLALYKLIPVTLSLSGIAGFILSVGMAVDANVLIFERLKEELHRGRTLQSALEEGFRRAWLSIRDSNFTTLISCAILFYTSSSLIRGFALTLGIGVLVSMFSAIIVSRALLRLLTGWSFLKSEFLYLPGLNLRTKSATTGLKLEGKN